MKSDWMVRELKEDFDRMRAKIGLPFRGNLLEEEPFWAGWKVKERLSALQKWILRVCYQKGGKMHGMWRRKLVLLYGRYRRKDDSYCAKKGKSSRRNKEEVAISRSLRSLYNKGYLEVYGGSQKPTLDITIDMEALGDGQRQALGIGKYIKALWLTDGKGTAKAKRLLNVKK